MMIEIGRTALLREFLEARLAEDEAAFEAAVDDEVQRCRRDGIPDMTADEVKAYWIRRPVETQWPRYLAEIAAKRAILADYERLLFDDPLRRTDYFRGQREALGFALQHLAEPYSDHPDYRQEWA